MVRYRGNKSSPTLAQFSADELMRPANQSKADIKSQNSSDGFIKLIQERFLRKPKFLELFTYHLQDHKGMLEIMKVDPIVFGVDSA